MSDGQAPWDKTGEKYDEAKARSLILSLREEVAQLKESKSTAEADRDKYKDRLESQKNRSKSGSDELKELRAENLKLNVQINTGLTDQQYARLVGNTFDEKMADAEVYAEESNIQLRSMFEPDPEGTPDDQGGDQQEQEQEKVVERNYRAPGGSFLAQEPFNPTELAKGIDL